jgi:2-dehydropantoate 2-reductase
VLRYAIIGTGAIGGYYGARLQQAGCDVHFLLRSDYEAVQQNGLQVTSVQGDFELPVVNAYRTAAEMPAVDVAVVALKTTHNHQLPQLLPSINPGGAILSLQNGFDVEGAIAQALESAVSPVPSLLGGLCFICSNKVGPGNIHHLDYGRVLLGAHRNDQQPCAPTALMEAIFADFKQASIEIAMTDDLPMARWQKLVWNVPYNGLSVVLDATTAEMMNSEAIKSLVSTLMSEVVSVANAWGQATSPQLQRRISTDVIATMLSQTAQMKPYRTSMKIDYDEGRSLELEAILGNPLRAAQQLGVPVPTMTMLYQQLTFLDSRL